MDAYLAGRWNEIGKTLRVSGKTVRNVMREVLDVLPSDVTAFRVVLLIAQLESELLSPFEEGTPMPESQRRARDFRRSRPFSAEFGSFLLGTRETSSHVVYRVGRTRGAVEVG